MRSEEFGPAPEPRLLCDIVQEEEEDEHIDTYNPFFPLSQRIHRPRTFPPRDLGLNDLSSWVAPHVISRPTRSDRSNRQPSIDLASTRHVVTDIVALRNSVINSSPGSSQSREHASHSHDQWRGHEQLMMDMRERKQEAARAQQPDTSVHASATYIINSRRSQDRVTPILDGTASYSVAQNSHHSNIANFELPHRTDSPHVGFEDVPRRDSPLSVSMVQQQHVVHRLEESDSEEERRDRRRRHEEYFQSLPRDSIFTSDSVYLRAIQIRLRENSEYFLYGDSVYVRIIRIIAVIFIIFAVFYTVYAFFWPHHVSLPPLQRFVHACGGSPARATEDSTLSNIVEFFNPFDDDDFTRYINDHAFSFIDNFDNDPRNYDGS